MRNVIKSAVFTFLQAWLATFLLALTGWLQDLLSWVSDLGDGGEAVVAFPDPNALLKLVASGLVSLVIAVVTAVHTYVRNKGALGEPPSYPTAPAEVNRAA